MKMSSLRKSKAHSANKVLHLTVIPLRFIAASELDR